MKNIEDKNRNLEQCDNSLDGLNHGEIAKKFDDQMKKLESIRDEEDKESEEFDKILEKIDDNDGKIDIEKGDTKVQEGKNAEKYEVITNRSEEVQQAIIESERSVQKLVDSKGPFSWLARKILETEK